jgi:hypothetical protein
MVRLSNLRTLFVRHAYAVRLVLGVVAWIAVAQAYPYDSSLPQYAQY